jgi:CHAT domain-containing protein
MFAASRWDPGIGPAEALRRSMSELIKTDYAHPQYWAPFVIVGEGAAVH